MKNILNIKGYLLRSFFATMILIGILQAVVNAVLGDPVKLMLENAMQLEGAMGGSGSLSIGTLILQGIFILLMMGNLGTALEIFDRILGTNITALIDEGIMINMKSLLKDMSEEEYAEYILRIILLLLLLVVMWVLPFVIGGIVFTLGTSRKVNRVENERIEKEKEFDRQRNLLLSDVAHDIKTPMTTIAGYSKALCEGDVPEEKKQEYLNAIYGKTMHTSELVSLLFEYVKLDSTGFKMNPEKTDICELVRECVAGQYMDFERKNMEVRPEIPERPLYADVDIIQTRRAVNNLLTNSIKHNPEKTRVSVEVTDNRSEIRVWISDNGNRIDRETAIHIFDPFIQGDRSRTSGSGSGLGLSVTKKIVDMQGGRIILYQYMDAKKYGKVKTFEIVLPKSMK